MEKILNSALNYAKQGIKVFPLKNTSNTDITLNSYQNMATTDITKITEWFTNTDYHVGVSTGDGLIVIEVENKKHTKELMQQYIKHFPNTLIVRTPEDSWHFYYRVNRNIETTFNVNDGIHVYGQYG
ncbi:bifunctional DNA primase/polymerase, partial [Coprobacillus cateniformis]|nr:bifunctional DNA primase/polymerase [Coprobacillus cateniformis]